jgi:hypothetical protein
VAPAAERLHILQVVRAAVLQGDAMVYVPIDTDADFSGALGASLAGIG